MVLGMEVAAMKFDWVTRGACDVLRVDSPGGPTTYRVGPGKDSRWSAWTIVRSIVTHAESYDTREAARKACEYAAVAASQMSIDTSGAELAREFNASRQLGASLRRIQAWQNKQFGKPTNIRALLNKLRGEIDEIQAAVDAGDMAGAREEVCDVVFMVVGFMSAIDMTHADLFDELESKLPRNEARTWTLLDNGEWKGSK
jgi:phosphoribosyl-ATP pyrophosphohydrolase